MKKRCFYVHTTGSVFTCPSLQTHPTEYVFRFTATSPHVAMATLTQCRVWPCRSVWVLNDFDPVTVRAKWARRCIKERVQETERWRDECCSLMTHSILVLHSPHLAINHSESPWRTLDRRTDLCNTHGLSHSWIIFLLKLHSDDERQKWRSED